MNRPKFELLADGLDKQFRSSWEGRTGGARLVVWLPLTARQAPPTAQCDCHVSFCLPACSNTRVLHDTLACTSTVRSGSFSSPAEPSHEIQMVPKNPHFLQEFRPAAGGRESLLGLWRDRPTRGDAVLQLAPDVRPDVQGIPHDTVGHASKVRQLDLRRGRFGYRLSLLAIELD